MDQNTLRNQLFALYFNEQNGIFALELLQQLSFITDTWQELFEIFKKNIKHFDDYSRIETIKSITNKGKSYLIIKRSFWEYIVIDIEKEQNLSKEEVIKIFDESVFYSDFSEIKPEEKTLFTYLHTSSYNGDIRYLIDFYRKNEEIFKLPTRIFYKLDIEEAWTCFYIDLMTGKSNLGFRTPDQYLYEHLYMDKNLTPLSFQDAVGRVGLERMKEIFNDIKKIQIPISVIPPELHSFCTENKEQNIKLEKKR